MAKELLVSAATGLTIYAIGRVPVDVEDNIGRWANITNGALEDYVAANFAQYAIVMPELGKSGFYEADMPTFFNNDRAIEIIFYQQLTGAGGTPAENDTKLSASRFELIDDWISTLALTV